MKKRSKFSASRPHCGEDERREECDGRMVVKGKWKSKETTTKSVINMKLARKENANQVNAGLKHKRYANCIQIIQFPAR